MVGMICGKDRFQAGSEREGIMDERRFIGGSRSDGNREEEDWRLNEAGWEFFFDMLNCGYLSPVLITTLF